MRITSIIPIAMIFLFATIGCDDESNGDNQTDSIIGNWDLIKATLFYGDADSSFLEPSDDWSYYIIFNQDSTYESSGDEQNYFGTFSTDGDSLHMVIGEEDDLKLIDYMYFIKHDTLLLEGGTIFSNEQDWEKIILKRE